jgi:hypothetical protein
MRARVNQKHLSRNCNDLPWRSKDFIVAGEILDYRFATRHNELRPKRKLEEESRRESRRAHRNSEPATQTAVKKSTPRIGQDFPTGGNCLMTAHSPRKQGPDNVYGCRFTGDTAVK